jgi:hypothetical protein
MGLVASRGRAEAMLPAGYGELVEQVKAEVRAARVRAARVVNVELIDLYWRIGRLLLDQRREQGWGAKVVERLSADLRAEFPGIRGLAPRSLEYMQAFASAWPLPIAQQPVARLPWGTSRCSWTVWTTRTSGIGMPPKMSGTVGPARY